MHSLQHILVGTDFSSGSDAAIDAAIRIAQKGDLRVTLVHVACPTGTNVDDQLIATAGERLEAERVRRGASGVQLSVLLRMGRPVEKLLNAAAEVGAALIVVGRSGADGASELGAVADRLVRTARRPVLVVTAKERV